MAVPAYEWAFDDVNPPVHAWAAWRVYVIDGARDHDLPRADPRQAAAELRVVGRTARIPTGKPVQGGFLGLDNIGLFDRSRAAARRAVRLEQSDATAWMAFNCLIADAHRVRAARDGRGLRGRGHQVLRALLRRSPGAANLAAEASRCGTSEDSFFYDALVSDAGDRRPAAGTIAGRAAALLAVEPAADVGDEQLPTLGTMWRGSRPTAPTDGRHRRHHRRPDVHRLLRLVAPERLRPAARSDARREPAAVAARRALAVGGHRETDSASGSATVTSTSGTTPASPRPGSSAATPTGAGPIWLPVNVLMVRRCAGTPRASATR